MTKAKTPNPAKLGTDPKPASAPASATLTPKPGEGQDEGENGDDAPAGVGTDALDDLPDSGATAYVEGHLIPVYKDGQTIEVHPTTLSDHVAKGWIVKP